MISVLGQHLLGDLQEMSVLELRNVSFQLGNVSSELRNISSELRNISFELRNVSFQLRNVCFAHLQGVSHSLDGVRSLWCGPLVRQLSQLLVERDRIQGSEQRNVSFRLRNVGLEQRNVGFRLRNFGFRLRNVSRVTHLPAALSSLAWALVMDTRLA
jgi:hypothetical protein